MNILSQQAFEKMREIGRDAERPSPLCVQTVKDLAEKLGLDADRMLAGEGVEVRGTVFHVVHSGAIDSEGLTLVVRMGELADPTDAAMLKSLLEHNASTSSTLSGHYGVMPGSNAIVLQTRFDLAKSRDPSVEILRYIDTFTVQTQAIDEMLKAGMELAQTLSGAELPAGMQPGC